MVTDTARRLAEEIRMSPEYEAYENAKKQVEEAETSRALIKEYKRLQMAIQMGAMGGQAPGGEDMQRFTQIATLLYAGTDTSQYLMAEMRLQKMVGDVLKMITEAAGLHFELPGGESL